MADMTIESVRQKFPQYNDLSDEQLAQGIHKKYYSDMAFEDFSKKIGYGKQEPSTFSDVLTGAKTAIMEPVYGLGEFLPQEYGGKASAEAAKKLESEYQQAFERSPYATRAGYIPTMLGTLFTPGLAAKAAGYVPKISEAATFGGRALQAAKEGAVTGGVYGALEPTRETDQTKRLQEKAEQAGISAVGGAVLGPAGEALIEGVPAVAKAVKTAVSPEKTILEKIPSTVSTQSEAGDKISKTVIQRLKDSIADRQKDAKELFEKYYARVEPYQDAMRNEYADRIREYALKLPEGSRSQEQLNLIRDTLSRMENPSKQISGREAYPNARGMDLERRRLGEIADQKAEGYGGAAVQTARDLEKIMTEVLNSPKGAGFDNVLSQYAKLSEPINLADMAFGQKVTKRAGEYIGDLPAYDTKNIINKAFESRDSVEAFRRLTGNNEPFVQELAKDKLSLELKAAKSPADVQKVIDNNIDWLSTPQMYGNLMQLKELQSLLRGSEIVRGGAKILGGGALAGLGLTGGSKIIGGL